LPPLGEFVYQPITSKIPESYLDKTKSFPLGKFFANVIKNRPIYLRQPCCYGNRELGSSLTSVLNFDLRKSFR
jgi:hypothetical protein